MAKLNLQVGDQVEAYVKRDARSYTFKTEVLHITTVMQGTDAFDAAIVRWDKGFDITPNFIAMGFPAHLEGEKVFFLRQDPGYIQPGEEWGKVLRKLEKPKPVEQIRSHEPGGANCRVCNRMVQYASANMSDNSFVCRDCRLYKSWRIPDQITFVGFEGEREV